MLYVGFLTYICIHWILINIPGVTISRKRDSPYFDIFREPNLLNNSMFWISGENF